MGYIPHKIEDFGRRSLSKSTAAPQLVELLTFIDGRQFTFQQSRKCEGMFFLSRPSADGFEIEIVERGPAPFTDYTSPDDENHVLRGWEKDALAFQHEPMHRRGYTIEGDDLNNASKIEVVLRIDGTVYMHMHAREPGLMGFLNTPFGFDVHVIGPKKQQYPRDHRGPSTDLHPLYPWQTIALELEK